MGQWWVAAKNDCLTAKDLQHCRPVSYTYSISHSITSFDWRLKSKRKYNFYDDDNEEIVID